MDEQLKPPIYSPEKDRALRKALGETQLQVLRKNPENYEEILKLQNELINFVKYLRGKYNNAENYSMFHILGGSTPATITNEDFPGEDSVEKFLNDLIERYK